MNNRIPLISLCFMLPLAGCPGESGDPVGGADAGPEDADIGTPAFLCEVQSRGVFNMTGLVLGALVAAFSDQCQDHYDPDELAAIEESTIWIGDNPDFVAQLREACQDPDADHGINQELIDRGNLRFDTAKIEDCRDAGRQYREAVDLAELAGFSEIDMDALSEELEAQSGACLEAVTGVLEQGEECIADLECGGDLTLRCELDLTDLTTRCLSPAALGEGCYSGATPRTCDPDLTCHEGTCQAYSQEGDPCGYTLPDCAADLFCQEIEGEPNGACRPPLAAGEDCSNNEVCGEGLYCHEVYSETLGRDVGTCVAPSPAGDSCADGEECEEELFCSSSSEVCTAPLANEAACDPGALCEDPCFTCRPALPGGDASACLAFGVVGDGCTSTGHCAPGHFCDATGTCAELGDAGDNCLNDGQCKAGLVCDLEGAPPVCVEDDGEEEPAGPCGEDLCPEGAACTFDSDCVEGLLCADPDDEDDVDEEVCLVPPAEGAPCHLGYRCGDEHWCDDTGDDAVCLPRRAVGEPCPSDDACATQSCYRADLDADGQCAPVAASGCTHGKDFFPTLLFLSVLLGGVRVRRRLRRAR